jgi:hypothetical protein
MRISKLPRVDGSTHGECLLGTALSDAAAEHAAKIALELISLCNGIVLFYLSEPHSDD